MPPLFWIFVGVALAALYNGPLLLVDAMQPVALLVQALFFAGVAVVWFVVDYGRLLPNAERKDNQQP